MNESLSLRDASVQDIQLELIRRTTFNAMNGERIVASLLAHRDLWLAALLDRPGVPNYSKPGQLLMSGLIKLRDLPENYWNADTLFLLTQPASKLAVCLRSPKRKIGVAWSGFISMRRRPTERWGRAGKSTVC